MQGSVRPHQKHMQQTAFSGYLLPLKADSQGTVQTDQCSHTYYYPTPWSCIRLCPFYKYTPLWRRRSMTLRDSRLCWRSFSPCGLVPYNFKRLHLGEPMLILFLTIAYVTLNQWLVILARMFLLVPLQSFCSLLWCGKLGWWKSVFRWSVPPGASLSCTERWLSSQAWNWVLVSVFSLLLPKSWLLLMSEVKCHDSLWSGASQP